MASNKPQYPWEERSLVALWNDFQPQRIYYPLSSLYPSIAVIALITLIHYILDRTLSHRASKYANSITFDRIPKPSWIVSCKYASKLSHSNLIKITKTRFPRIVNAEFPELSHNQKTQLISYHKQCIQFEKHVSKYLEAAFKVLVFGFVYFYGLALLYFDGDFFFNPQRMWDLGPPQLPGTHPIFNLNIYYFLQIGYHGHRALYQFVEHSRRDFVVMFVHHWVTVFCLIGSKIVGYQQIGATVLLCTDNSDLLMPLGKLCEYEGYKTAKHIFTVLFLVLWIPLRIGVYFYKVLWSIAIYDYTVQVRPFFWSMVICCGLLIIYILQFYWTAILLKMIWRDQLIDKLLKGKRVIDPRSDNEGDNLKRHED